MSSWIIKAEGLGKRYRIRHQQPGRQYKALRDVLTDKAKALFRTRKSKNENRESVEDFWALRDVSFEIQPGEVVGIIGRNGAGKSTLLKLLSRITEPTEGRVTLRGRVASLLEVGTGFHPELTGRENIFLNGAILGMSRAEIRRKFDEIVAFAEVEKFLDTPVKRYSSGMYVRLAFAVAAHLEPEILVVDEVLAVGDAEFQKKCLGKMQDVAGQGRTVLFVSHNMEAVDRLTSRCLYLRSGALAQDGPTQEVVSNYLRQATSGEADIARYRTHSEPGTVTLAGLWSETMDGVKSAAFRQGEPFRVVLEVDSPAEFLCDFAVVIETGQQHALYTTHLTDLSPALLTKGRRRVAAEFRQPMLRRGGYCVSIALFSPDKKRSYDIVLHYPLLEIAGTIGSDFPDDIRWGDLYVPVRWSVPATA